MWRAEILRFLLARAAIVVALLATVEAAFRLGAWEPLAKRESNAGQTVALRKALETFGPERLDFITLGDSRTVYGFDHERIAARARDKGFTHASVAIPGMHWMSMRALVNWLRERAPQIKGAVITTTSSNLMFLGNGAYELNLVAPFARAWDSEWMTLHVPFAPGDFSTYGAYSATFLYREDIRDWARHPIRRTKEAHASLRQAPSTGTLFSRTKVATDLCRQPIDSIEACAGAKSPEANRSVTAQCHQWKERVDPRGDFSNLAAYPHLLQVRSVRQAQLRELPYGKPIIVILMPMPRVWLDEALPVGLENWARSVLADLEAEGTIEVHDFTRFFRDGNGPECAMFWDLYHQNTAGQDRLTDAVLPILERRLYSPGGRAKPP